jgi:hypothetical protein
VDVDELVAAYWLHHRLSTSERRSDRLAADEFSWAWDKVQGAMGVSDDAVGLILRLAQAAPDTEDALDCLGAGPLENLIHARGAEIVDQIDAAARRDARLRKALSAVWYGDDVDQGVVQRLTRFAPPPA